MTIREDEGITGVTFRSDGNQLVGVLHLARGGAPKPTVLLLHGCSGLEKNQLAVTPAELRCHVAASTGQRPADVVGVIAPQPLLGVHGSADEWIPLSASRLLHEQAGEPSRYVEIDGANHAFAWHRAALRNLVAGWLVETGV